MPPALSVRYPSSPRARSDTGVPYPRVRPRGIAASHLRPRSRAPGRRCAGWRRVRPCPDGRLAELGREELLVPLHLPQELAVSSLDQLVVVGLFLIPERPLFEFLADVFFGAEVRLRSRDHVLFGLSRLLRHPLPLLNSGTLRPNDSSSASRPTGGVGCNRCAMGRFAAAHG